VEDTLLTELKLVIDPAIFQQNILDSGLPEHVAFILQEGGYATTGDLLVQMKRNSDLILGLQGIGPKALQEIEKLVESRIPIPAKAEEEIAVPEVGEAKPVEAPEVETEALVEPTPVPEPVAEVTVEPPVAEPELSFDELFKLDTLKKAEAEVEDNEDSEDKKDKKKKKTKSVVVEYDPDRDITIARKKHKRGDAEWEEESV
jgi:N utilization substance protein A